MPSATVYASEDTYIQSDAATNNFGSASVIHVDSIAIKSSSYDARGLLKFDLSSLAGAIVSAGTINIQVATTEAKNHELHLVTSAWTEGAVTWNTAPTVSTLLDTYAMPGANAWYTKSITSTIQGWISGTITNYGVRIKRETENRSGTIGVGYNPRETSGTAQDPYLSVTYVLTQTLSPGGIASGEASGASTIAASIGVAPGGVASAQAAGNPTVQATITLLPAGVGSAEALGAVSLLAKITLSPGGIASGQVVPNGADVRFVTILSPGGIASLGVQGNPAVAVGPITLTPGAIASGEALGLPTALPGALTLIAASIASAEAVGQPTLHALISLGVAGIGTAEAFGDPTIIPGDVILVVRGVGSAELFGIPLIKPPGVPWTMYGKVSGLLRIAPTTSVRIIETHGDIVILDSESGDIKIVGET